MLANPVIRESAYCLAHVPELVRYGSKPRREIATDPSLDGRIAAALRPFAAATSYPPNRVFLGALSPAELAAEQQPWYERETAIPLKQEETPFGAILSQESFYRLVKMADVLQPPLFELTAHGAELLTGLVPDDFRYMRSSIGEVTRPDSEVEDEIAHGSLPIRAGGVLVGCFRGDRRAEGAGDPNLSAPLLLESVCAKASGALALKQLLRRAQLPPEQVDFLISCGEEACGDRYQRGGGGMAKSIGEMCGCLNASGMDIKNFCAAPASAIVTAGSLVISGIYDHVVVVAGGSLAKLGMKFEAFLRSGVPILDDCLASMAFLITRDNQRSPILHLEPGSVGVARIESSTSDEHVYRDLILKPLHAIGLELTDVDKFAPELHNPEIMQFAGSGDVTTKNYRMIAALAVMTGAIDRTDMDSFISRVGSPGFAPTQGHIPSAVPYIGHASCEMQRGEIRRAMFVCKASLFLNRITELVDGVSFVLERNPATL